MITDFTKEHPDKTLWRFWIPMMLSDVSTDLQYCGQYDRRKICR